MKNLKFETYINEKESDNEYQPKVGQKMVRIFWRERHMEKCVVQNDEYGEYFMVPNCLNPVNSIFASSFTRRIKDAVESIKNGDGDCIEATKFFGFQNMHVHYYLDREVGEKLRQKTIEGFKDAEFFYYIYLGGNFGGCYLAEDESFESFFVSEKKVMTFDSDEEAMKEIEKIYSEAEKIISEKRYEKDSFPKSKFEETAFVFVEEDEKTGKIFVRKPLEVAQDIRKKEA